jgi:outer membrane protein
MTIVARPQRSLLLALLLLGAPAAGQAETLFDAIALAYQTNPQLREQRAQLRADDERLVQARAGYGPQINLAGQAGFQAARVQTPSIFTTHTQAQTYQAWTNTVDLSAVQPIWTSGALKAETRGAAANVLASRQDLRYAEAQLLKYVITAYLDVRRDRQSVEVRTSEIDALTAYAKEIRARGQLGQLTKTDVAVAESRLLTAQAQLALAQGRLNASNAEYLNLVGQAPGELQPEPDLVGLPASVAQAFDAAEQNNPQLRAALARERAAQEKVNQAKAALGPTVSLKLDAAVEPYEPYLAHPYNRNVTASVVLNQTLFASGANRAKVREAIEDNSGATLAVEALRRQAVQAVAQAWSQLAAARTALAIDVRQVGVQQEAVKGNRIEVRVGTRPTLDLLNAEQELANSRIALIEARHDEYVARAELLAAMGVLEAKLLVPNLQAYDPAAHLKRVLHKGQPPWVGPLAAAEGGAPPPGATAPPSSVTRPTDLPPLPESLP